MNAKCDRHCRDGFWEQYALGMLSHEDCQSLEEHLLICESCQGRLAREDRIRQEVRDAGTALELTPARIPSRYRRLGWPIGLVAAVLLILAGSQWQVSHRPSASPAVILLQTMRGADNQSPAAPAGKPLALVLDLTGLPRLSSYQFEIVDAAGHPVLESNGAPQGNKLQAVIAKRKSSIKCLAGCL